MWCVSMYVWVKDAMLTHLAVSKIFFTFHPVEGHKWQIYGKGYESETKPFWVDYKLEGESIWESLAYNIRIRFSKKGLVKKQMGEPNCSSFWYFHSNTFSKKKITEFYFSSNKIQSYSVQSLQKKKKNCNVFELQIINCF